MKAHLALTLALFMGFGSVGLCQQRNVLLIIAGAAGGAGTYTSRTKTINGVPGATNGTTTYIS